MRRKIIRLLLKLMGAEYIPLSEIIVTDDSDYLLALITPEEIVEHDGCRVIAH